MIYRKVWLLVHCEVRHEGPVVRELVVEVANDVEFFGDTAGDLECGGWGHCVVGEDERGEAVFGFGRPMNEFVSGHGDCGFFEAVSNFGVELVGQLSM